MFFKTKDEALSPLPFRDNRLEPRWRGCNLKARRACQIIAGGERSVTPGKPTLIFHPEGVAESVNKKSR